MLKIIVKKKRQLVFKTCSLDDCKPCSEAEEILQTGKVKKGKVALMNPSYLYTKVDVINSPNKMKRHLFLGKFNDFV